MVDSIGTNVVTAQDRLAPTVPARQAAPVTARPSEPPSKQLELSALARDAGQVSPLDEKRVEDVKRAVRNGTYPIAPETIADRMLALKLYWSPKK